MLPSVCCAIMLLVLIATIGAKPIIQGLLQEQMRPALFGSVQSLAAAFSFLVSSPVGRLTDLRGRAPALAAMLCVLVTSFGILAAAGPNTVMLCVGLVSIQAMKIDDPLKAAISDSTDAKNQFAWMQVLFACGGIGFGTGPMVGKVVNSYMGFTTTFMVLSFFLVLAAVLVWPYAWHMRSSDTSIKTCVPADAVPVREVLIFVAHDSRLRNLFLMRLCQACAAHMMFSTMGLFVTSALGEPKEKHADLLSIISSVFTSVQLAQPLFSKFVKLSCESAITVGLIIIACGRALLAVWATNFVNYVMCYSIVVVGIGLYLPACSAATTATLEANTVGLVLGLSTTMEAIAETTMPFIGGLVFESFGPYGPCTCSFFCSLLALIPAAAFYSGRDRSATEGKKHS